MKKLLAFGLLSSAIFYSCTKSTPATAPNPSNPSGYASQGTITATVNGVNMTFDTLAEAYIDTSLQIINLSGFVGVKRTDSLIYSGGFQETLSDYIYLKMGYDYGLPIPTGNRTDTGNDYNTWVDLNYGKFINVTYQPNYTTYGDFIFYNSYAKASVTSVADSVIQGTFEGSVFVDGDQTKKLVITNGKFKVKMTR